MTDARKQLDNLADAMVEDILSMTDEEIRAELIEDGEDLEEIGAKVRRQIDRLSRLKPA